MTEQRFSGFLRNHQIIRSSQKNLASLSLLFPLLDYYAATLRKTFFRSSIRVAFDKMDPKEAARQLQFLLFHGRKFLIILDYFLECSFSEVTPSVNTVDKKRIESIKSARKPQASKLVDEWPPGAKWRLFPA